MLFHVMIYMWLLWNYMYSQDYHSTENGTPKSDSSQDWLLLDAAENDFGTVLKFTRQLQTCDPHDHQITVSRNKSKQRVSSCIILLCFMLCQTEQQT